MFKHINRMGINKDHDFSETIYRSTTPDPLDPERIATNPIEQSLNSQCDCHVPTINQFIQALCIMTAVMSESTTPACASSDIELSIWQSAHNPNTETPTQTTSAVSQSTNQLVAATVTADHSSDPVESLAPMTLMEK